MLVKQDERAGVNESWINPVTNVGITFATNGVKYAAVSVNGILAHISGKNEAIQAAIAIVEENKPVMEVFCNIDALDALVTYENEDGIKIGWLEVVEALKPVMA